MGTDVARRKFVGRGAIDARGGLYSMGMPVLGAGDPWWWVKGQVYHVDNGHTNTSDNNTGKSPDRPMATINAAMAKTTAGNGDVVVLAEGHAETISSAALSPDMDVAGVTVIGLGVGASRPTFTFTHVDAEYNFSAASCRVYNVLLANNIDNQKIVVDINAADDLLIGCELREGSAKQFLVGVDLTGSGANAVDRSGVIGCKIFQSASGGNAGIELGEVASFVVLRDNIVQGDWADAGIHNPAGKVLTDLQLIDNIVSNVNAGNHAIEIASACTGNAVGNMMYGTTLGTIFDPGSLKCNNNKETDAIDQAGVDSPRTAAGPFPAGSISATTFSADAIDAAAIDTGAITSATFAAGAIDAAAIADDAIDLGAFADYAIGAVTIATGALTAAKFAADAIAAAAIDTGAITSATFAAGAIDAAAIANSAIDAATFAADAINAAAIDTGAITSATFAAGAIDAAAIGDDAIDLGAFADYAIGAAVIATYALTAVKIDTAAITSAKIGDYALSALNINTDAITAAKIADAAFDAATFDATAVTRVDRGIAFLKAAQVIPSTGALAIATVAGGHVLVKDLFGEWTVASSNAVCNAKLQHIATTGGTVDVCANVDIASAAVNSTFTITGTFANPGVISAAGVVATATAAGAPFILPPGAFQMLVANQTETGQIKWTLHYAPLEAGAALS